jgi:hypothetical protein
VWKKVKNWGDFSQSVESCLQETGPKLSESLPSSVRDIVNRNMKNVVPSSTKKTKTKKKGSLAVSVPS